jgi:hypothetical protein
MTTATCKTTLRFRRAFPSLLVGLLVSCCVVPGAALAEDVVLETSRCGPEQQARLDWLVDRLESHERYADLWWRGWIGFYGIGAVVEGVRAGVEDDRGKRADQIVSAVKAVGGVTRLYFFRPTARLGADPLGDDRFDDEAACRQAVEHAESLLRDAAEESDQRWRILPHLSNVAINMAGAVIVTEGFDENDGWASAAVGIAVGEAMIWSHPWTGHDDLEEYRTRFSAAPTKATWAVAPLSRGLSLQVRF